MAANSAKQAFVRAGLWSAGAGALLFALPVTQALLREGPTDPRLFTNVAMTPIFLVVIFLFGGFIGMMRWLSRQQQARRPRATSDDRDWQAPIRDERHGRSDWGSGLPAATTTAAAGSTLLAAEATAGSLPAEAEQDAEPVRLRYEEAAESHDHGSGSDSGSNSAGSDSGGSDSGGSDSGGSDSGGDSGGSSSD